MKKNTLIGIIVLMNLGLVYLVKQKIKSSKLQQTVWAQKIQQHKNQNGVNDLIADKYWWELNSHGQQVQDVTLVSDIADQQDTFTLAEVIGDSPKLVMRYSELHCDVCVDSTMKKLRQFIDEIGKENVVLISSYANPRDMYTFKRLNEIDFPMYNLGAQHLGLRAEDADIPYLFVIEPDGKAEMVFLAYKEAPGLITRYFNILNHKYFQG